MTPAGVLARLGGPHPGAPGSRSQRLPARAVPVLAARYPDATASGETEHGPGQSRKALQISLEKKLCSCRNQHCQLFMADPVFVLCNGALQVHVAAIPVRRAPGSRVPAAEEFTPGP